MFYWLPSLDRLLESCEKAMRLKKEYYYEMIFLDVCEILDALKGLPPVEITLLKCNSFELVMGNVAQIVCYLVEHHKKSTLEQFLVELATLKHY